MVHLHGAVLEDVFGNGKVDAKLGIHHAHRPWHRRADEAVEDIDGPDGPAALLEFQLAARLGQEGPCVVAAAHVRVGVDLVEAEGGAHAPDGGQEDPHLGELGEADHAQAEVDAALDGLHGEAAIDDGLVEALFAEQGPAGRRGLDVGSLVEVAGEGEDGKGEGVGLGERAAGLDFGQHALLVETGQDRVPLVEEEAEELLHQASGREAIFRQIDFVGRLLVVVHGDDGIGVSETGQLRCLEEVQGEVVGVALEGAHVVVVVVLAAAAAAAATAATTAPGAAAGAAAGATAGAAAAAASTADEAAAADTDTSTAAAAATAAATATAAAVAGR